MTTPQLNPPPPLIAALPARKNRDRNPFQFLLYREMAKLGWQAEEFERAFLRLPRVGVVHLHWPDGAVLVRCWWESLLRLIAFLAMLAVYKLHGIPVIWTAHNWRSHDRLHPRLEACLWWLLHPMVDAVITLRPVPSGSRLRAIPGLRGKPMVHIPHGEFAGYYREMGQGAVSFETPAGRSDHSGAKQYLIFGHIRPYKRIPEAIRAFRQWNTDGTLRIVGKCHDPNLAAEITATIADDPRIEFHNQSVPDGQVASLLESVDTLIITTDPEKNSGILHLAASFGLPALTQDQQPVETTPPPKWEELAEEHSKLLGKVGK